MSDGNGDTNDWKTRLDELIREKDEKLERDRRQKAANELSARTFMIDTVRPAFSELDTVFARHNRRAFPHPKDYDSISLTVKHGEATELTYSFKIQVSPQGAVATSSAQLPGLPAENRLPLTNLNDKNIALLTKEDIVNDVINCFAQSF